MNPRLNGASVDELFANGWKRSKQIFPAGRPAKAGRYSESRARTGDAVVESQHPDPSTWKHMMHSRFIRGIGSRRVRPERVPARHVFEVRVEPLRRRQPAKWRRIEAQGAPQQATRAARVNHKRCDDVDC